MRYNLPGVPDAACVIADATPGRPRDIAAAWNGGPLWGIKESRAYCDPLEYDRMHPSGERGWRYAISHTRGDGDVASHQFAS